MLLCQKKWRSMQASLFLNHDNQMLTLKHNHRRFLKGITSNRN